MADLIQVRRGLAAEWTSANPVLAAGELGLETDTNTIKSGDGTTAWTSLSYYQGAAGAQGPAGADGADGAAGPTGAAGADGAPGATGPAGSAGATGATGPAGPTGPTGPAGPAGADGADGATGPAGTNGNDGAQGPAGADGSDGAQGPAGADGSDGSDGATGPAGADGSDGADGQGVPAGGTADQVLVKINGTDYNTEWADNSDALKADLSGATFTGRVIVDDVFEVGDFSGGSTTHSGMNLTTSGQANFQAVASAGSGGQAMAFYHGDTITYRLSRDGTIKAANMVDIGELQAAVAGASDFAALKTAIAALSPYTP